MKTSLPVRRLRQTPTTQVDTVRGGDAVMKDLRDNRTNVDKIRSFPNR